jgi:DNA-binding NarL/FixJ family response regulator
MIRIVVIDSEERYRQQITAYLSTQKDFEILKTGKDGYEALRLVDTLKPDILLLDINLRYIDGVQVTSILRFRSPRTAIIILTTLEDDEYVLKAICNGASGYLLKSSALDGLAEGIRTVHTGGSFMTPRIAAKAFRLFSEIVKERPREMYLFPKRKLPNISGIEFRITTGIVQGLSNREIAENLHLQEGTVRNYISSILQKTGLRNRTQVAIYAIKNGWINPK